MLQQMRPTICCVVILSVFVLLLIAQVNAAFCDTNPCNPGTSQCDANVEKCICNNGYYGEICDQYIYVDNMEMLSQGNSIYSALLYNQSYALQWSFLTSPSLPAPDPAAPPANAPKDITPQHMYINLTWNKGFATLNAVHLLEYATLHNNQLSIQPQYNTHDPAVYSTKNADVSFIIYGVYYVDGVAKEQIIYTLPPKTYTYSLHSYSWKITPVGDCQGLCEYGEQGIEVECAQYDGEVSKVVTNHNFCKNNGAPLSNPSTIDLTAKTQRCALPGPNDVGNTHPYQYQCQNGASCVENPTILDTFDKNYCACVHYGFSGQYCQDHVVYVELIVLNVPQTIFANGLTAHDFEIVGGDKEMVDIIEHYNDKPFIQQHYKYIGAHTNYYNTIEKQQMHLEYFHNLTQHFSAITKLTADSFHIAHFAAVSYENYPTYPSLNLRVVVGVKLEDFAFLPPQPVPTPQPRSAVHVAFRSLLTALTTPIPDYATSALAQQLPQQAVWSDDRTHKTFNTIISRYSSWDVAIYDPACTSAGLTQDLSCPLTSKSPFVLDDKTQVEQALSPYRGSAVDPNTPNDKEKSDNKNNVNVLAIIIPIVAVAVIVAIVVGVVCFKKNGKGKQEEKENLNGTPPSSPSQQGELASRPALEEEYGCDESYQDNAASPRRAKVKSVKE